jgi:hypothetical protein
MSASWKFEVQTLGDGDHWSGNGQRFAKRNDAVQSAMDLASRWTLVVEWRVVESDDAPNQDRPTIKGPNHRVKL